MSTETHAIPAEFMAAAEAAAASCFSGTTIKSRQGKLAIARAINDAVMAERARIVAGLLQEAEVTPCGEDAMVTRSNAFLIKADFSYEEAERLSDEEEA